MKRHISAKTALVGLLVAPVALPQEASAQQTPAPGNPPPPPNADNKPADPNNAPAATMSPVTVVAPRPSQDFTPPPVSLGRVGDNVQDIPQSIVIINKALMQSQGATSLQSAIKNVPGVTIGAAEGGSIGNNFNLNGFSARTDLYLDGMRDPAQYYRDTFDLEQIEILMGPASMLFGRGSTGGVINQVLKKPSMRKFTDLSQSVTSNGLVRSTADINLPVGEDAAVRVPFMFQVGKTSTRNQTEVLDFGFAPSYKFGIGTPTEVTLYSLLQRNHDHVDYGVPPLNGWPANVSPNNAYGYSSDYTDSNIAMVGATVEHKFNKDVRIRNQTQVNYVSTYVVETAPNAIGTINSAGVFTQVTYYPGAAQNLWVRQQSHDRNIIDLTIDNQTEFQAKFDTGPVKHDFLAGMEIGYESYRNQNYTRTGTCGSTTFTASYTGCTSLLYPSGGNSYLPEVATNLATSQANWVGIYGNDNIQLLPWFKLVGGVRQDIYTAQIGNSVNSANTAGNTTVPYQQQTVTFTSVRTGPIIEPTPEQSYYFSYSTSFNPSLEQLTSTTGSSILPPTTNEAFEVGAKYDLLKKNLSLTGALFQITQYNARSPNGDGTYSATGNIRVKGARIGVAGRITEDWQVFGGYTYLDGRIINGIGSGTAGNVPLNTPRDSATLWSTYTFAKKYEIGGGPTYIGQRYANNTNTVTVPGFVRWDATAAYKLEKYDVRLNVFNIGNVLYYDQVIASDGGRAVPGSGLTAMLTFNVHL
ncbi:TonB-dependent receptor [Enhydrobacter aerosaccus]|nr:TonB-dependent siderophore receptor [Enhydrobacter aerosaccus]